MIQTTTLPGIIVNLSEFRGPLGAAGYAEWVEELGQDLTWGDAAYTLVNLDSVFSVDAHTNSVLEQVRAELHVTHPGITIFLNLEG